MFRLIRMAPLGASQNSLIEEENLINLATLVDERALKRRQNERRIVDRVPSEPVVSCSHLIYYVSPQIDRTWHSPWDWIGCGPAGAHVVGGR